MRSRIATAFAQANGRALFIPYLTAGFPELGDTARLMAALEEGGADLIEIGVPFSDPSADGPVIQSANERALANGSGLRTALDAAAKYRDAGGRLPVVLMGYANPFMKMGAHELARECVRCAVDGVLAVDWPARPGDGLGDELRAQNVDRILLIAPTTGAERARSIAAQASGYLYYVSVKGVTGAGRPDLDEAARAGARIRALTVLPVAIGFGVREPADCGALGRSFDAVVVGSRLISAAAEAGGNAAGILRELAGKMRSALR